MQWVADIRLNPSGQLAGFTKQEDLADFLRRLVAGCRYVPMPILAPTKETLTDYRADADWARYQSRFEALMDERNIPEVLNRGDFEEATACLLCSEPSPDYCHRRFVAERLGSPLDGWGDHSPMTTQLVITDLTRMQEGRVCVAGYDSNFTCIRPMLPPPGIHERSLRCDGRASIFPFAR